MIIVAKCDPSAAQADIFYVTDVMIVIRAVSSLSKHGITKDVFIKKIKKRKRCHRCRPFQFLRVQAFTGTAPLGSFLPLCKCP